MTVQWKCILRRSPLCQYKYEELLLSDQPALVIFDSFTSQGIESLPKLLEDNHIHVVMVPAN